MTVPQRLLEVLTLAEGDELQIEVAQGQIVATRACKAVPTAMIPPALLSEIVREEQRMAQGRKLSLPEAMEQIAQGANYTQPLPGPAVDLARAGGEIRARAGSWRETSRQRKGRTRRTGSAGQTKAEPEKKARRR